MVGPSSSIYSQDVRELGYTPFEYWKGPKRVSRSYWQQKEATGSTPNQTAPTTTTTSSTVVTAAGSSAASAQLAVTSSPLQPDHLHAAQLFLSNLGKQQARPDIESLPGTGGEQQPIRGKMPGHGYEDAQQKGRDIRTSLTDLSDRNLRSPPPIYSNFDHNDSDPAMSKPYTPWYDVRGWARWVWAVVVGLIIAIIVAIVVAVVVTNNQKANRYPDYSKLNYTLADTYSGTTFFDKFDYFNTYDPAGGFVHYVDSSYAATYNLTYATSDTAVVKVDTTVGPSSTPDASTGRFSVRLESKTQYSQGLFVFDVKHTPYGCGTWPALWLTDPNNWPANGEIDVMEAVNQATSGNLMSLHTDSGCDMSVKRLMTGTAEQADCNNATNSNAGCGVEAPSNATYGPQFNAAGGGIMALEWRSAGIRVWQFGRSSIPTDITNKSPDPSSWGTALADFPSTECDIGSHFKNQSIIVNIDLCGDLTNAVYASSGCPSNCTDYVANNPSAFTNAYWEFGSFQVYSAS
ncbi:putative glycosidase [Diplogelasinospora grovesii]|uniref:endo-1,3(4)-beta-glucanase n=1 Tax=Diplogelasinospora grovesii TaxID=303347 RepID=A0AAN6S3X8_9PEZI|nr:putative glycosidase [Diplogelasinospora grovesii]